MYDSFRASVYLFYAGSPAATNPKFQASGPLVRAVLMAGAAAMQGVVEVSVCQSASASSDHSLASSSILDQYICG